MSNSNSRRRFLKATVGSSLVVGVDAYVPSCLLRAAENAKHSSDKVLVVVQLSGGNDGLNTVIPIADDEYRKARPSLAIGKDQAAKLNHESALHPSLSDLADLFEDGLMSIVHGVGYERPNRSHFESMDIWHTCQRKNEQRSNGWLGRFLDSNANASGGDVPALHFGREKQPLALAAKDVRVPSVKSLDEFRLKADDPRSFEELIRKLSTNRASSVVENDLLSFVQASTSSALVASKRVNDARTSYQAKQKYPETRLAKKLSIVAQLIDAELATRIYYVELGGFDTHSAQANTHAILLREWGEAVSAFVRDISEHGHLDRVNVMTFSEFGRRVAENASGGTDHGAAAPVFFAGGGLKDSIIGEQPSLEDLQDGDLKYAIDFRQVYSTVLNDWLKSDAEAIVGDKYPSLALFAEGHS